MNTPKYKLLLVIFLQLFLILNSDGQMENLNRIYTKIVFEDITLRDTNNMIIHEDEIIELFYRVDTIISCFGAATEEFEENLYTTNIGIALLENEIDTVRSFGIEPKIEFFKNLRKDNGDYKRQQKLFWLKPEVVSTLALPIKFNYLRNDKKLLTEETEYWSVSEIKIGEKKVYLDKCHQKYRLYFSSQLEYNQNYQGKGECQTKPDKGKISNGHYFKYWEDEVIHNIFFKEGKWKTKNNKLYFASKDESWIKMIPYQIIDNRLTLEPERDYRIILERQTSR